MNADGALLELAARHGIEHGYHDIWGNWHPLTRATAQAVLGAMGVPADDEQAIERALAESDASAWSRTVPPVTVAREHDAPRIALCLPAAAAGGTVEWQLALEEGTTRAGSTRAGELALLDARTVGAVAYERREFVLPEDLPPGYHALHVRAGDAHGHTTLIVAPRGCHEAPLSHRGTRPWGMSLQLYGLRSARNWGIGDFGDLAEAVAALASLGADMVGLNPLHALFPDTPSRISPYSPSSRRFLNPGYLCIEEMADFAECATVRETVEADDFQARLTALRDTALVDYGQALPLKFGVLRDLYGHFRKHHADAGSARRRAFDAFCETHGEPLHRHAVFEALHARHGDGAWPTELRDPRSPAVQDFAREHADDVAYSKYLQWQASVQLEAAAARARECGMRIGLYLDLAVGSNGDGADVWAEPALHARGVSVGAPPDDFSLQGQVWGLPPWTPQALRESAYAPFAACLRANMRAAGALRIDHVLGLLRLFWVPCGGSAADGAYVHYPVDDLLAVTALESRRAACVVVGEDLGTVPDAIRAALAESGVLSYRVLYFEKHWHGDHSFRAPEHYPAQALVTVSTHDLATLAGFWTGHDLELRRALDLFPSPQAEAAQRETRHHDRWRLLDALGHEGLRPANAAEPGAGPPDGALVRAVHRFLARSPAAILNVQMEDVLGEVEQVNVPGTVDEHANWRRKLSLPLECWAEHAPLRALADAVSRERAGDRSAAVD